MTCYYDKARLDLPNFPEEVLELWLRSNIEERG